MLSSKKANRDTYKMVTLKPKFRLTRALCWTLISIGSISLTLSIIINEDTSTILAFIGLGLVFWGAILIYIQPEEYTKKVLLDATIFSSLENLNQIVNELGYNGSPICLPPKYFSGADTNKLYIAKQQGEKLPDPKLIINQEKQLFLKNPGGLLITPPGVQLKKIFEKRLNVIFTQVDLQYFKQNLPKLFIEDLEIAEALEIEIKPSKISPENKEIPYGTIHLKLINSILKDTYKKSQKLPHIFNTIGNPIFSAIACTLTHVTGKPLTIEKIQSYESGEIIEVTYKIRKLEYQEQPESPLAEFIEKVVSPSKFIERFVSPTTLSKLPSLILIVLGLITLAWIGQLTFYLMGVHLQTLDYILFIPRTEEPIGLGIGMKVIYYYLIGLALIISGTLIHLRKKRGKM